MLLIIKDVPMKGVSSILDKKLRCKMLPYAFIAVAPPGRGATLCAHAHGVHRVLDLDQALHWTYSFHRILGMQVLQYLFFFSEPNNDNSFCKRDKTHITLSNVSGSSKRARYGKGLRSTCNN